MTQSRRKAVLEGGSIARRSYLWSARKPNRYTAWESLGICPRPGTAQNIFLIITCMNRKFASYSCKWYQAGRDFKYFGGWAGTSKQSWHIREIAWKKTIGCNLVETKGKLAACVRIVELHGIARAGSRRAGMRQRISAWTKQPSSCCCKSSKPQAGTHKRGLQDTWSDALGPRGTVKPRLEYAGYDYLGRLWAGGRGQEMVRSKKLQKKPTENPDTPQKDPKKTQRTWSYLVQRRPDLDKS